MTACSPWWMRCPSTAEGDLEPARRNLSWIVGRDVQSLDRTGLLRAAAETASENAVDGIFAPLFWMGIGALLWMVLPSGPGPLALGWGFKASASGPGPEGTTIHSRAPIPIQNSGAKTPSTAFSEAVSAAALSSPVRSRL